MAFTVEDGTGLANANALASTTDVSAYLNERGGSAWLALTTEQQQAAIVVATDYISNTFDFLGDLVDEDQALALPTDEVDAGADLPGPILGAVARLAYAVGVQGVELYGTVSSQSLVKRVKAGAVEVEFADQAVSLAGTGRPDFPWLAGLLAKYVNDVTSPLSRKVERT